MRILRRRDLGWRQICAHLGFGVHLRPERRLVGASGDWNDASSDWFCSSYDLLSRIATRKPLNGPRLATQVVKSRLRDLNWSQVCARRDLESFCIPRDDWMEQAVTGWREKWRGEVNTRFWPEWRRLAAPHIYHWSQRQKLHRMTPDDEVDRRKRRLETGGE